jgi:hypothetical protein
MSATRSTDRRGTGSVTAWVTLALAVSAAITGGFWTMQAVGEADTEALESPLILSVARQLVAGPGGLYGPFGRSNPLVLIHAPLYYRAAALLAWPLAAAGSDPIAAARRAGRAISAVGLLATLAAAYRLARLGGAPRRAGWWAALLIAAAPVLDGLPVAVRPDLAGVALQTAGVLLVLRRLEGRSPPGRRVEWAYAAFGLAACVKQHLVAAAAVSAGLLLAGWWRGRVSWKELERGVLVGLGVVAAVYGLEGLATGGRIWQASFVAAGRVGRVHPGDWDHVGINFVGIVNRTAGLIVLLAAAGLSTLAARPGLMRKILAGLGTGWIGLIVGLLAHQAVGAQVFVDALRRALLAVLPRLHALDAGSIPIALAVIGTFGVLAVVIPVCALVERSRFLGSRLDLALWLYLAGEVALFTALFRLSTGSWLNYAIQAVVFAGVLTARAVSRAADLASTRRPLLPVAVAVLGVLAAAFNAVFHEALRIRADRAALELVLDRMAQPSSAFFFADHPGLNRVHGRPELVFDGWLYPVFESEGLAEPRTVWLRQALATGPIRVIVKASGTSRIEGVEPSLYRLGYRPDISVGPFYVWRR